MVDPSAELDITLSGGPDDFADLRSIHECSTTDGPNTPKQNSDEIRDEIPIKPNRPTVEALIASIFRSMMTALFAAVGVRGAHLMLDPT
jgi:hypothetical protein